MAGRPREREGTAPRARPFAYRSPSPPTSRRVAARHDVARTSRRRASRVASRSRRWPSSAPRWPSCWRAARCCSGASGSPSAVDDPLANAVRAVGGAPVARTVDRHAPQRRPRRHRGHAQRPRLLGRGRRRWCVHVRRRPLRRLGRRTGRSPRRSSASRRRRPETATGWSARDGGVFAFGDAAFHGSIGNPGSDDRPDRRHRGDAVGPGLLAGRRRRWRLLVR